MKYAPWLVVLLVAGFWVKGYGDKRASDALAKARRDSLETVLETVKVRDGQLAAADSALAVHEAADRARALATRRAFTVATARADSTAAVLDSELAALPDTAPLHIAIIREREFGTACRGALDACTDLSLTLTARVDTLTAERDLLRPALARTEAMWRDAERRAHPSIFGKFRTSLPLAAVAVGVVLLVK